MISARNEAAIVCKWEDKKDVISNKHKAELVRVTNRRGEEKMEPNIVADYNLGMSDIDRSDQMLHYYQGLVKQFVGIKKLAFIS